MRSALTEAGWHAAHRSAFGRSLIDQPLMRAVLTDLALRWKPPSGWVCDCRRGRPRRARLTENPPCRFQVLRLQAGARADLRGHGVPRRTGYVESVRPRLYREAPVNSIWEGSGQYQRPRSAAGAGDFTRLARRLAGRGCPGAGIPSGRRPGLGRRAGMHLTRATRRIWNPGRWLAEQMAQLLELSPVGAARPEPITEGFPRPSIPAAHPPPSGRSSSAVMQTCLERSLLTTIDVEGTQPGDAPVVLLAVAPASMSGVKISVSGHPEPATARRRRKAGRRARPAAGRRPGR